MGILNFLGIRKNKIGVALGSGGIKGFSHIGVLKVLKQNNIPISYMSGTSAGALIGGMYLTHDQSIEKLESVSAEIGTKEVINILADFSLNGGFIRGSKALDFLNKLLNNANIEDLPIPFVIVTTNLKTGFPMFIKKGNLAEAIRASSSLPLIFKPAKIGKHLYIDGGVSMPVPIKPLKEMGANRIIASNMDSELLPLEILKNDRVTVNPIERAFALMVRDMANEDCREADVTISPNFRSIVDPGNVSNYAKRKEIITLGEIETLKHIEKIRRLV